jgi:hypothetical protein
MTEQMNGKSMAEDIPPSPQNVADFLTAYIGPVMSAAINGCLRSLSNVPIEAVLIMSCAVFGRCIGQILSIGDLVPVMGLRKRCIEAFTEELKKVKINPMAQPPGKPQSAVPPETAELLKKIKAASN